MPTTQTENASTSDLVTSEPTITTAILTDAEVDNTADIKNNDALSAQFSHETVLLVETVNSLLGIVPASPNKRAAKKPKYQKDRSINTAEITAAIESTTVDSSALTSGVFVDATFGRGGHSKQLLKQLADDATLIVFDKDPQAIDVAEALAKQDKRVIVMHDSFASLQQSLTSLGISHVDGIMADLGVSSPQLDDGSRGFSFMREGAIDMRMDTSRGQSVGEWLADVDETVLADVLYEFGEERHSRRIARAIKGMENYTSTLELAEVIKQAHPKWKKGKHPATQSFQAMRIFINNELGDVDDFLEQTLSVLAPDGWLAVISFHSLEDRRIKQFLQRHSRGQYPEDQDSPMPIDRPKYFGKPSRIAPSEAEVVHNTRSRSAWLRLAQRTHQELSA